MPAVPVPQPLSGAEPPPAGAPDRDTAPAAQHLPRIAVGPASAPTDDEPGDDGPGEPAAPVGDDAVDAAQGAAPETTTTPPHGVPQSADTHAPLVDAVVAVDAITPATAPETIAAGEATTTPAPAARKRPRPGERRVQILQTLAAMLEQPGVDRVTTAALAARLGVSEAALYRHFASKAQMFEGLIDFIETSVFTLVNQVAERESDPALRTARMCQVLLQFGEKNPGMTRVMVGDALVFEHERLVARMNQFFDRIESQLRQSLRAAAEAAASPTPSADAQALASALTALVIGRLQRYARSGFKRLPTEHLEPALQRLAR